MVSWLCSCRAAPWSGWFPCLLIDLQTNKVPLFNHDVTAVVLIILHVFLPAIISRRERSRSACGDNQGTVNIPYVSPLVLFASVMECS